MNESARERLPAVLNVIWAAAACGLSFLPWGRLPVRAAVAQRAGFALILLGMGLILWAVAHLKKGFYGSIRPRTDALVTTGPYRFVRHPAYVGMALALAGIAVAMASAIGLACVVLLFVPSLVWRARCEDRALQAKFGAAWERYAAGAKAAELKRGP